MFFNNLVNWLYVNVSFGWWLWFYIGRFLKVLLFIIKKKKIKGERKEEIKERKILCVIFLGNVFWYSKFYF